MALVTMSEAKIRLGTRVIDFAALFIGNYYKDKLANTVFLLSLLVRYCKLLRQTEIAITIYHLVNTKCYKRKKKINNYP